MLTHSESLIIGVAAGLAAALYIGQQLRKLAGIVKFVTELPAEHRALLSSTQANTMAIAELTVQVTRLTADVDKMVRAR